MRSAVQSWTFGGVLLAAALAAPGIAVAESGGPASESPWYLGVSVGASLLDETDYSATSAPGPASRGPLCGVLDPLGLIPQALCNLLGGSSGTPGSAATVATKFDAGPALSATLGYHWGEHLRPELTLSYASNDVRSIAGSSSVDGKATSLSLMANAWYDFLEPSARWRPYVGLGLGLTQVSNRNIGIPGGAFADGDDSVLSYQLGGGVGYALNDRWVVSADYRYHAASGATIPNPSVAGAASDIDYNDHVVQAGLRYYFRGSRPGTGLSGDGAEGGNPCRFSPDGVPAEFLGPDGCPLDTDGDGVPDHLDECPKTPAGVRVLANGCALKGDCRTPRPGEEVDANGCAIEGRFVLRGVKFEFDSDRLLPASKRILDDVAVEVEGHTDWIGTDAYNLALSERRANAVRSYLMEQKVDGNRLLPVAYGESRPLADNETEEGREENRRVEFRVAD
jgi:opacity protein-like surface antigen